MGTCTIWADLILLNWPLPLGKRLPVLLMVSFYTTKNQGKSLRFQLVGDGQEISNVYTS